MCGVMWLLRGDVVAAAAGDDGRGLGGRGTHAGDNGQAERNGVGVCGGWEGWWGWKCLCAPDAKEKADGLASSPSASSMCTRPLLSAHTTMGEARGQAWDLGVLLSTARVSIARCPVRKRAGGVFTLEFELILEGCMGHRAIDEDASVGGKKTPEQVVTSW